MTLVRRQILTRGIGAGDLIVKIVFTMKLGISATVADCSNSVPKNQQKIPSSPVVNLLSHWYPWYLQAVRPHTCDRHGFEFPRHGLGLHQVAVNLQAPAVPPVVHTRQVGCGQQLILSCPTRIRPPQPIGIRIPTPKRGE